jgi:FKBP-type peptidyl-prolyl cis-trans isomerase FklB
MKLSTVAVFGLGLLCANVYADDQNIQTNQSSQTSSSSADSNKAAGEKFLATNKAKEGVVTLPSGLQYKVITEGKGEKPSAQDTVTVNYEGKLLDGTVFDSSYQRGQPATFQVSDVIPGWVEALQLMKTGSTWEIYIPSQLAYGEQGAGQTIGPNQTLIFKVELLGIKK